MSKNAELFSNEPLSRFDELIDIVSKANPEFVKASTDSNARIECKVQSFDIAKNLEKVGKSIHLHLPLKMRVLSKGTKASLILSLGVAIELCESADRKISWCNYKFNNAKFENSVKSSNCDGVDEAVLIEYFFKVVSSMQFYPFDEELKALMDFCDLEQDQLKHNFEALTSNAALNDVEVTQISNQDESTNPELLDLIA